MVVLRIAIGWHFLYEGIYKIKSGTFSSTPYLMASAGPLRDTYRSMVYDVDGIKRIGIVLDKNGNVTAMSPQYQLKELDEKCKLISQHYDLDAKQKDALKKIQEDRIKQVEEIYAAEDLVPQADCYVRLCQQVAKEEKHQEPKYLQQRLEYNQGKVNKARGELLARVEKPKKGLDASILLQREGCPLTNAQQAKGPLPMAYATGFPWSLLTKLGINFKAPSLTKWQDLGMMFGLCVLGACLILGLFTRLAALGAAVFLVMFYTSMPPFPWVMEVPPLEGHYWFVNKNLIELIACLMIASSLCGRWFGLDAFIGAIWDRKRNRAMLEASLEAPAAPAPAKQPQPVA
ncbi:MAG: hypothetical protein FWC56_02905 [Phycisphaerae bacterium]|nr:hypothetical protein [Phycisphaerae bacterium]